MSFSLSQQGTKEDIVDGLNSNKLAYSDPAPGVTELMDIGIGTVDNFLNAINDDGKFSVSVSGHAKQNDGTFRDSLSVSISPITE